MRAMFDGQDYMVVLDEEANDWRQLQDRDTVLQAPLGRQWEEGTWGKILSLKVQENTAIDGIEVTYGPEGAEFWDDIQQINVAISWRAHMLLGINHRFGTRYNGSDKIEIFYRDPALLP